MDDPKELRALVAQLVHADNRFRIGLRDVLATDNLADAKQLVREVLAAPEPEPTEATCPGCGRRTDDYTTVLGLRAVLARALARRANNGSQCG